MATFDHILYSGIGEMFVLRCCRFVGGSYGSWNCCFWRFMLLGYVGVQSSNIVKFYELVCNKSVVRFRRDFRGNFLKIRLLSVSSFLKPLYEKITKKSLLCREHVCIKSSSKQYKFELSNKKFHSWFLKNRKSSGNIELAGFHHFYIIYEILIFSVS